MSFYNHKEIEPKWQKYWADNHTFKTGTDASKPKFYALDIFPYPSGAGLKSMMVSPVFLPLRLDFFMIVKTHAVSPIFVMLLLYHF